MDDGVLLDIMLKLCSAWASGPFTLLLLSSQMAAAQQTAAPAEWRDQEVIEARNGDRITLDYGRIEVPENRRRVDAPSISVAYVVARSPREDAGVPVFFLAGGPGGSSIESVKGMVTGGGGRLFDLLGGDFVGIDQRGVGLSQPNLESPTLFGADVHEPGDPARQREILSEVCRAEAARWREQGVDLDGYNTEESADDIDAVRQALGYEKIALWGGSYGSHLALATIRRHEAHIARALLVGPEGPDHTVKLPSYAQTGLERIGELVAADGALAERIPDFMALVAQVLDRFDGESMDVEVDGEPVGISKFDVQQWLAARIGRSAQEISTVPAALVALAEGDASGVARDLLEERRTSGVYTAMGMAMDAASGMSKARAARIAAEADDCLLGDVVTHSYAAVAEAWGVRDLGDAFRGPLDAEVPVLIVVGDLDARTPEVNARELAKELPNAHVLVVENAAHQVPMGFPELREAWSTFLCGGEVSVSRIVAPPLRFAMPGAEASPPEGTVAVEAAALVRCAGDYTFPNGMVATVSAAEGHLVLSIPGKGDFELWPESPTRFRCDHEAIPDLTFAANDAGEVVSMSGGGMEAKRQ
ncbi:MAG: alpha/beta fold hydrolase [Planctomycetota bacterium]